MLGSLRKASKGWVSKILLLLLILSMVVWGAANQVGGGIGAGDVLASGESSVSQTQYRLAYNQQVSALSQRLGTRISNEQAQMFGVQNQVIGRLVSGVVLDEQARSMKLGLSEERLATLISQDEGFQGLNGQQIRSVLQRVGMREADYIKSREGAAKRQQVIEAISDGMNAPQTFTNALFEFTGQTRDISYLEIDESSLDEVTTPDDAALSAYFEENKAEYRAPEYRKIKIITLTPDTISSPEDISDDDIRAEYDVNTQRYSTPERRTVQQLVFGNREDAEAARERILAGETFEEAVVAAGKTLDEVTLGTFESGQIPAENLNEPAFALASTDEISPVIDGLFGPVLVRVSDIEAEIVQPFEDVADQIRAALAELVAQDAIPSLFDGYEDGRAGGLSMEEAAADQDLEVKTYDAVDRQGLDQDGNDAGLGAQSAEIIRAAFGAEVEIENSPLNAGQNGYLWYEVAEIIEERDRTLDEVKERVSTDWIEDEKTRLLNEKAELMAEALRGGAQIDQVAQENNYPKNAKFGLARDANDADLGQPGVQDVFSIAPEGVGITNGATGNKRVVFKIDAINTPLGSGETLPDAQKQNVNATLRADLLDQMVNRLQLEFPVSINQSAAQQAITGYAGGGRHGGM